MRLIRFVLCALFVTALTSCGTQPPTPTKAPPSEPAKKATPGNAAAPATPAPPAKPADQVVGNWKLVKNPEGVKTLNWSFSFEKDWQDKFPRLRMTRKSAIILLPEKTSSGPMADYTWGKGDTIEVKLQTIGGPPQVQKLKIKVGGDELMFIDEAGAVARYQRQPTIAGTIKVTGLALCCETCADSLKTVLAKEKEISEVAIDVKDRSVTLKVPDENELGGVTRAVDEAGMHGSVEVNGRKIMEFGPVGQAIGGTPASPPKEIVFKNIHACCGGCQKTITELAKGGKVTFEGDGPTKTVKITGDKLNSNEIVLALWKAGFRVGN